jgi:hypothetical protein
MSIDTSTDSVRWLAYPEAAKALGVAPASVAKRATRRRWPRRLGNDGRARIGVPIDALPEPAVSLDSPGDSPPDSPGDSPPDSRLDKDALNRTIGRLEAENSALRTALTGLRDERDRQLADLRAEREAERETLRGTVEALKAALEAERELKGELRRELERLSRPWWRRLAG